MQNVLVVGELNVDVILNRIDGLPEVGKERLAQDFTVTLGSSSAIFARNLAVLGSEVSFIGKIGEDSFGDLINSSLADGGVDTSMILKSSNYQTGSTIVLNYDMDRAMVTYPGAMEHMDASEVSDDSLSKAGHLHISSIFLQPALKYTLIDLLKRAKAAGMTTSLDPQWDPAEKWDLDLKSILPYIDVFLPNRKELMLLTKSNSIHTGIERLAPFANVMAIKDGENGAVLFEKGEIKRIPAFLNQDVIDAIGAGDSFDAGFIHQFTQGKPLEECIRFANLTGAINTTSSGGTTAFQTIEQIKSLASERFSYSF